MALQMELYCYLFDTANGPSKGIYDLKDVEGIFLKAHIDEFSIKLIGNYNNLNVRHFNGNIFNN